MKCRVCRGSAIIDLKRHNANFCAEHFLKYCKDQVEKAIKDHKMIQPGERCLVAVSGGKDSLAVWDLLVQLGYEADGLYVGLGIGEYSNDSGGFAKRFADARGWNLISVDLQGEYGYNIPEGSRAAKRAPCSACGLTKRHLFDKAAIDGNYDVLITGHNLDDEAAVLFGNTLRWQTDYLGRQQPVLEARQGFPRKVKPLIRLDEREMAAYCIISGIDYVVDECPMAVGNRHIGYKEALNAIEVQSPGTKHDFYHGFLKRVSPQFREETDAVRESLNSCTTCGAPTTNEICAFCVLVEKASAPVTFVDRKTRRAQKRADVAASNATAPSAAESL